VIAFFCDRGSRVIAEAARALLRISERMSLMASDMKEEQPRMLSKLTLALATTAVIGLAALAPSNAEAHWRGYGWYGGGYGYGYGHSYWKPHYGYDYGHYGYKPRFFGYSRHFHRNYGWYRGRGYY
jgi:hypothetical protein